MTYYDLNSNCTKVYFHVDFLVHFQRLAQFADLEAMRTLKFVSWQESYLVYGEHLKPTATHFTHFTHFMN